MKIKVETGDKLAASVKLSVGKHKATVSAVELKNFRKVAERLGIEFDDVK